MVEFSLAVICLLIIYLINKHRKKIAKKTKLIDKPDKIRKLHEKPTPLLGGLMVFSSFLSINLYLIFFQNLTKTLFIIFICCTGCFILGLIDDIRRISYKKKFLLLIIIFYLFVSFDQNLQINKIYFSTFNRELYLNYLSIPFTVLCLLLLINSINLIDGLDGLCIIILIIILIWLMSSFDNIKSLDIILILSLVYILYLNLKKYIFFGDSGSLFFGCLIGLNIILNYNLKSSKMHYPIENIFIALMLPGIDMLRVFIERFIERKNPFLPDRKHLHYLLLDSGIKTKKLLIIICTFIIVPILVNYFTNVYQLLIISIYVLLYVCLIIYLNKSKKLIE